MLTSSSTKHWQKPDAWTCKVMQGSAGAAWSHALMLQRLSPWPMALGAVVQGQWRRAIEDLPSPGAVAAVATLRRWQEALKAIDTLGAVPAVKLLVHNSAIVSNKSRRWERSLLSLADLRCEALQPDIVSFGASSSTWTKQPGSLPCASTARCWGNARWHVMPGSPCFHCWKRATAAGCRWMTRLSTR